MKTLLSLSLGLFLSFGLLAQDSQPLKGPKAKNAKAWNNQTIKTPTIDLNNKKLTGPEAKNTKVWENKEDQKLVAIQVRSTSEKLQGPAAKNNKPWQE